MDDKVYCKDCCNYSGWFGCFASGQPIVVRDPVTGTVRNYVPGTRELAQCNDRRKIPSILNANNDCTWYKPRPWPALKQFMRLLFRRPHA